MDPEVRQALQQMQERTEQFDRLMERHAPDLARLLALMAELTEQRVLIDQLVAWVHGADMLPELTAGAQALKCLKGTTNEPF